MSNKPDLVGVGGSRSLAKSNARSIEATKAGAVELQACQTRRL